MCAAVVFVTMSVVGGPLPTVWLLWWLFLPSVVIVPFLCLFLNRRVPPARSAVESLLVVICVYVGFLAGYTAYGGFYYQNWSMFVDPVQHSFEAVLGLYGGSAAIYLVGLGLRRFFRRSKPSHDQDVDG